MATVYKIELEIVSAWVNFTPSDVERMVKVKIEETHEVMKKDFEVTEIKVERKN